MGGGPRGGGTPFPGQIQTTVQVDKVVRFQASGALSAVQVKIEDLLDMWCVATGTTAAYKLMTAFKLRKIEMWGPPSSSNPVTVAIEDLAVQTSVGGPSRIREDTTLGVSRPAHVVWTPAPGSAQALWQGQTANVAILELTGPSGTIVDLHASWLMQEGETPAATNGAVAGATVGQVYVRAMDSNGSSLLKPTTYITI